MNSFYNWCLFQFGYSPLMVGEAGFEPTCLLVTSIRLRGENCYWGTGPAVAEDAKSSDRSIDRNFSQVPLQTLASNKHERRKPTLREWREVILLHSVRDWCLSIRRLGDMDPEPGFEPGLFACNSWPDCTVRKVNCEYASGGKWSFDGASCDCL